MIWISSDTHFGHENIKEYCGRPDNFERLIIDGYKKVGPDDCLIHLGDVAFANDALWHEEVFMKMKCRKILILGNHDKKTHSWYQRHGWDFVCLYLGDCMFGVRVLFTHKPIKLVNMPDFDVNIHGHLHTHESEETHHKNHLVSLEKEKYQPVLLESLLTKYKKGLLDDKI